MTDESRLKKIKEKYDTNPWRLKNCEIKFLLDLVEFKEKEIQVISSALGDVTKDCEREKDKIKSLETFLEKAEGLLNINELHAPWEDTFYEDEWNCDTLHLTDFEKNIINKLTTFLPRHMQDYDWNLPYAEMIILILRQEYQQAIADYKKGE